MKHKLKRVNVLYAFFEHKLSSEMDVGTTSPENLMQYGYFY